MAAWLDTGTHKALTEATEFIKTIEKRTSLKEGCVEEIAYLMKNIDKKQLKKLANDMGKSSYGDYLKKLVNE